MEAKEIFEKLQLKFGEAVIELAGEAPSDQWIKVDPSRIFDICLFLRDDDGLLFDYMVILSGMDYKDSLGVVYHLYSFSHKHRIVLKAVLDRESPSLPSVEKVWKSANWHEREAWDMYGIVFENHPNLIRILTPYDWEDFPLRKDYKTPEFYHDIKIPY